MKIKVANVCLGLSQLEMKHVVLRNTWFLPLINFSAFAVKLTALQTGYSELPSMTAGAVFVARSFLPSASWAINSKSFLSSMRTLTNALKQLSIYDTPRLSNSFGMEKRSMRCLAAGSRGCTIAYGCIRSKNSTVIIYKEIPLMHLMRNHLIGLPMKFCLGFHYLGKWHISW